MIILILVISTPFFISFVNASPYISLSSNSGPRGTPVTVSGSGFTPNTYIAVNVEYIPQCAGCMREANPDWAMAVTSDSSGGFKVTYAIPTNTPANYNAIFANNVAGYTTVPFTITSGYYYTQPVQQQSQLPQQLHQQQPQLQQQYRNSGKHCTGPHMSFTIPVYMIKGAAMLDDGQTAYFSGSHSFLVSAGTHHWDMWGYNYQGHVYHWSGVGTAYDCVPYSYIAG